MTRMNVKRVVLLMSFGAFFCHGEASALSLEELAERVERLERKVAAYEKRYGSLEGGGSYGGGSAHEGTLGYGSGNSGAADASAKGASGGGGGDVDAYYGLGSRGDNGGEHGMGGNRTDFGGYGELHLNLGDKEEVDFHRWVLFLRHKFSDRVTLYSELELEHALAGEGKDGEIELEQAYVDFALDHGLHAKAGVFLLPVGILNEVHEPDTFFGTERNPVEKNILPSTWWEAGLGLSQTLQNGFGWDFALHSGLDVSKATYNIRSGRQKVSEAPAMEPAVTGRLRYSPVSSLDLSVYGQYQNDVTQGDAAEEDNSALLLGGTASWRYGGFGLRGLVGHWSIDGETPRSLDADRQWGYYIEPSYTWQLEGDSRLGVFARFNNYKDASGEKKQYDFGLNYWPLDNVVLKADFSLADPETGDEEETYNFGVGYSF